MDWVPKSLATWVKGKRVIPPVPPGRVVVLTETDDDCTSARRDDTASLSLFVEYIDSKGERTARRIACRNYDRANDMINAWCFERDAKRAFRCDRIVSAACTATGEVFDLAELVARLRARGLPVRDARLNATLKVLTFLMRCDGVHPSEEDALEEAIGRFALRFDGDDAMVDLAVRQARTMAPDERDFLRALQFVARRKDGPALARFIQAQARQIIDADGWHSRVEVNFGVELDNVLARVAAGS